MSRLNAIVEKPTEYTHGGSVAVNYLTDILKLRRSVLSCFLWENEFYEDGEKISNRIIELSEKVPIKALSELAIETRNNFHLRHVPLLLTAVLAQRSRGNNLASKTLEQVIQRPDELGEFLAIYAKINDVSPNNVKKVMSAQVKKGLAKAFTKFDAYQLAKYNRKSAITLRDVLFLTHATPKNEEQASIWKKLIDGTLESPDTWEVGLSTGKDKKETFERLIKEGKLGYLALLRNLRNMQEAGCDYKLIKDAILARKGASKVLPFRYIAAAKFVPKLEDILDQAFLSSFQQMPKLPGKTIVIIDVSGSMYGASLSNGDMNRATIACSLGAIARELCEEAIVYATAGNDHTRIHQTKLVPSRRGIPLVSAIEEMCNPLGGGGIFLKQVIDFIKKENETADRIICITDEQDTSMDGSPKLVQPFGKYNYLINVASAKNGIGYGKWTHIDGFSEKIFDYILANEDLISAEVNEI